MTKPLLSLALLLHVGMVCAEPTFVYSPYESKDYGIRVGRPGDKKLREFPKAYDPAISPDGKQVVVTLMLETGRRLEIIDLTTGKRQRLPVEAREMYGALWSPDGKWIAFNILTEKNWGVSIIRPDGTGLRNLTDKVKPDDSVNLAGWNFKTGEPLAQDLDTLWQLSLEGEVLWKRTLKDLTAPNGVDSSCRFWVLPDGKTVIGNVEVVTDEIDKIDGPSNFLVTIDLDTAKRERISPKGLHVGNPFLTYDASAVLFQGFVADDLHPGKDTYSMTMRAYRMKLSDRKVEPIFQNATSITQSKE